MKTPGGSPTASAYVPSPLVALRAHRPGLFGSGSDGPALCPRRSPWTPGLQQVGKLSPPGGEGFNGRTGGLHTVRQLIFKLNGMGILYCQYWWQFRKASTWNIQKFWEFLNYEICCYNFWDLFCHLTLQDFDIHLLLYRTSRNTGKMESIPQNNKT